MMFRAICCFVALSLTGVAFAQQAASPTIGPYRLGMSLAEANAAAPATILDPTIYAGALRLARGQAHVLGVDFTAALRFGWNSGLLSVVLTRDFPVSECQERFTALVDTLEHNLGALSDGPVLEEAPGAMQPIVRTEGGGQIRSYRLDHAEGYWVRYRASRAPTPAIPWSVSASADVIWLSPNSSSCYISAGISAPSPPELPNPMIAELAGVPAIEGRLFWDASPTAAEIHAQYPRRAEEREREGATVLGCRVRDEGGTLRCFVQSETPEGWGFGAAAMRLVPRYRIVPMINNQPTAGRRLELRFEFRDPRPPPGVEEVDPLPVDVIRARPAPSGPPSTRR